MKQANDVPTWKTGNGEKIAVKDMTNGHLLNTIRYLRKCARRAWNQRAMAPNPFNDDTMTSFSMEQEQMSMIEDGFYDSGNMDPPDYDLKYGPCDVTDKYEVYPHMIREAERRGLDFVDEYEERGD